MEQTSTTSAVMAKQTNIEKIEMLIKEQADNIATIKQTYENMKLKQKTLLKILEKVKQKMTRPTKPKENRKPCGFARPTPVSKEMCEFLKVKEGTEVSRTTVTRALIDYIKDNKLQQTENKKQINPDETLYKLFGEEARHQTLTYFTMQKFVNHHFQKKAV
jgi:chromatin remodeling complex protein RSC6